MKEDWYIIKSEDLKSDPNMSNLEGILGYIKEKHHAYKFMLKSIYSIPTLEITNDVPNLKHSVICPYDRRVKARFNDKRVAEIYSARVCSGKAKVKTRK